ncbi:MFS-type transporter dbaD [Pseudocercospora fuligena]|uniref:MFS-type transporter dbaD n=1 Tax=Pseudocercospora fuligena TaxID=685502 RepID=A0A8H6VK90_9PEZI|nr:MFS-type transporter dbaD [Pseudocercospora fuligena]
MASPVRPEEKDATAVENRPLKVQKDSGVQAWSQVVGAFCWYFNTWGLLASYGSFQSYYEEDLLRSNSSFQISTIGSLQSFLLVFLGFLAGPLYDAGYSRHLLSCGTLLIVVGTIAQSFCTQLWQLLLAQGLCIGLGCGCLAVLSVAIPTLWFTHRLPLANGIAASGSGLGGVILPIVIRNLLGKVGFGWTVRAIALIVLTLLACANLLLRVPQPTKQRRRLIDVESLTDWPYICFVLGCFCVFLGMYTPFYYVQTFALRTGLASESVALYIVTAMNCGSIPGRIIPAFFAQHFGPLNMIILTTVALAACGLGFLGVGSIASVYVVAVLYGFFSGTFFALQPTVFARLTSNMAVLGTRFGMAFTVLSIALLFGTPISGALQGIDGYDASWAWAGATLFAGSLSICIGRMLKAEWKPWKRL